MKSLFMITDSTKYLCTYTYVRGVYMTDIHTATIYNTRNEAQSIIDKMRPFNRAGLKVVEFKEEK